MAGVVSLFSVRWISVHWVGSVSLDLEFQVTDAKTGEPISNAEIQIRIVSPAFCEDLGVSAFTLNTDEQGNATKSLKSCMCYGTDDSFEMHLPQLWFHATAEGYSPSIRGFLDLPKYHKQIERVDGHVKLRIPIPLYKQELSSSPLTTATVPDPRR